LSSNVISREGCLRPTVFHSNQATAVLWENLWFQSDFRGKIGHAAALIAHRPEAYFHRCASPQPPHPRHVGLHMNYAFQASYETLLRSVGAVTEEDVRRMAERFALAGDDRDVLDARKAVTCLLGFLLMGRDTR
jgi:hypothetical protein